jgi:hypothetical protein
VCAAYKQQQDWEKKRQELVKSAAKGFFSSTPVVSSATLSAVDEDHMFVPPLQASFDAFCDVFSGV